MSWLKPNCCDWHRDGGSSKLGCGDWDVMSQSYFPSKNGKTITVTPGRDTCNS
jgi:hypothetical protein